jgi:hypothetical protein
VSLIRWSGIERGKEMMVPTKEWPWEREILSMCLKNALATLKCCGPVIHIDRLAENTRTTRSKRDHRSMQEIRGKQVEDSW